MCNFTEVASKRNREKFIVLLLLVFVWLNVSKAQAQNVVFNVPDYFASGKADKYDKRRCDYFFDLFKKNAGCPVGRWFLWGRIEHNRYNRAYTFDHNASIIIPRKSGNLVVVTVSCEVGYLDESYGKDFKKVSRLLELNFDLGLNRGNGTYSDKDFQVKNSKIKIDGKEMLTSKNRWDSHYSKLEKGSARRLSKAMVKGAEMVVSFSNINSYYGTIDYSSEPKTIVQRIPLKNTSSTIGGVLEKCMRK